MSETPKLRQPPGDMFKTLGDGEVISAEPEAGKAEIAFTVKENMCHSGYICQGGFVAGWIDAAMAHAVMYATDFAFSPATLEMKTTYLKAATLGTRVRARGWIEKRGRHVAFVEGDVLNEEGVVLAKATSTVQLMPMKKESTS